MEINKLAMALLLGYVTGDTILIDCNKWMREFFWDSDGEQWKLVANILYEKGLIKRVDIQNLVKYSLKKTLE